MMAGQAANPGVLKEILKKLLKTKTRMFGKETTALEDVARAQKNQISENPDSMLNRTGTVSGFNQPTEAIGDALGRVNDVPRSTVNSLLGKSPNTGNLPALIPKSELQLFKPKNKSLFNEQIDMIIKNPAGDERIFFEGVRPENVAEVGSAMRNKKLFENDFKLFSEQIKDKDIFNRLKYFSDDLEKRLINKSYDTDIYSHVLIDKSPFKQGTLKLSEFSDAFMEAPDMFYYNNIHGKRANEIKNTFFKSFKEVSTGPEAYNFRIEAVLDKKGSKSFIKEIFGDDISSMEKYKNLWKSNLKEAEEFESDKIYQEIIDVLDEVIREAR